MMYSTNYESHTNLHGFKGVQISDPQQRQQIYYHRVSHTAKPPTSFEKNEHLTQPLFVDIGSS